MPASSPVARPLRPTDLPVLASLWARGKLPLAGGEAVAFCNEARVWERLGLEEHSVALLERALQQWAPIGSGRLSWVAVRGLAIRGVASARRRARRSVWEVDHLVGAPGEEGACVGLLEELARGLGRSGVEKVFLRLDAHSRLLDAARSAGFFPYLSEQLWRLEQPSQGLDGPPLPMRLSALGGADLLPLFQLYNATVPATVRRCEALTLREWAAMQERGRCQHLVLEKDGRLSAWLRLARHNGAGCFALLASRRQDAPLDNLLVTAMHYLHPPKADRPIFCLVPEYERGLAARLADLGFQPVAEYAVLANRLARPIEEAVQVPSGAHQPYPVS
ncbi:MAG TPA: hypothetical protein VJ578_00545 [Dehalococcoidia bacterium]|nr:hypothetical protein [Dehalococcoidia bacterium]